MRYRVKKHSILRHSVKFSGGTASRNVSGILKYVGENDELPHQYAHYM